MRKKQTYTLHIIDVQSPPKIGILMLYETLVGLVKIAGSRTGLIMFLCRIRFVFAYLKLPSNDWHTVLITIICKNEKVILHFKSNPLGKTLNR